MAMCMIPKDQSLPQLNGVGMDELEVIEKHFDDEVLVHAPRTLPHQSHHIAGRKSWFYRLVRRRAERVYFAQKLDIRHCGNAFAYQRTACTGEVMHETNWVRSGGLMLCAQGSALLQQTGGILPWDGCRLAAVRKFFEKVQGIV